jgi:hypothetical protein
MHMPDWEALAPYAVHPYWASHYMGDQDVAPQDAADISGRLKEAAAASIIGYLRSNETRTPVTSIAAGAEFDLAAYGSGTVVAYRREHLSAVAGIILPPPPLGCTPAERASAAPLEEANRLSGVQLSAFNRQVRYRQDVVYGAVGTARDGETHLLYAPNGTIDGAAGTAASMHPGVLFREHAPLTVGTIGHHFSSENRREILSRILAIDVYKVGERQQPSRRRSGFFGRPS